MTNAFRFLRVCFAYLASTASAMFALLVIATLSSNRSISGYRLESLAEGLLLVFKFISGYSLIPAITFVAFCETKKIRNIFAYLAFSALLALSPILFILSGISFASFVELLSFFLPPGLAAGYVYWWLAGRYAGGPGPWA